MKRQNGYINLDGFFIGLVIIGAVIGVVVCLVAPWLWSLVKPFIHAMTA